MTWHVTVRRLHKAGNAPDEYEDAAHTTAQGARSEPAGVGARTERLAVADGATESALSGEWARMLAQELCECPLRTLSDPHAFRAVVTSLADRWPAWLRSYVRGLGRPLHYWEPRLLTDGAAATVLAVALASVPGDGGPPDSWTWQAAAVGDCELFQVRDGLLVTAFPLTTGEAFGRTPALVHSLEALGPGGAERVTRAQGLALPGDVLLLASDALAAWALFAHEAGTPPWDTLTRTARGADTQFPQLIAQLRADGVLRNDDVTLVAAVLGGEPGDPDTRDLRDTREKADDDHP